VSPDLFVTDTHAHWVPPSLATLLRARVAAPRIEQVPGGGGEVFVTYQGLTPLTASLTASAERLSAMALWGISRQVLSLSSLFGVECLPALEAAPLCAAFNNEVGELATRHPDRFLGLAILPLADPTSAAAELERAHTMGLRGAVLAADGFQTPEDAARLATLLRAADRLGSHLFIHPGPVVPPPERMVRSLPGHEAWQRRIVLETQGRLSEAVVTLGLSGLLDAYPGVTVQVANLGGAIPFLVERMDEVARREGAPLPSELLRGRRLFVDTASFGPRAIAQAVACFGVEHILLGSDCPIFDAGRAVQAVEAAELDMSAKALVLSGNAGRLFG
jgi:predicted TIM-barrel fold metal-dependent hydrolase